MTYWEKREHRNDRTLNRKYEHEKKVIKGVRGMPRLSEAKKDVISCEKPRGLANTN